MAGNKPADHSTGNSNRHFFVDLARAYGGAILFSFPMLMTMELWWLGFSIDGVRLAIFTVAAIPLLIGLSYYDGFEETSTLRDDAVDTFVAYAIGFSASAAMLFLFGVINAEMSWDEVVGKISIQAVVASLGAMLTQSLLVVDDKTEKDADRKKKRAGYAGQLFLMAIGAIFLSMSVAPTEEIVLISYQLTYWQIAVLSVVTLLMKYAFVYAVKYQGHDKVHEPDETFISLFMRFTVVGYAIALLISFYILWTFGSIDGMDFAEKLKAVVVLAFPAAIGASASRLIL